MRSTKEAEQASFVNLMENGRLRYFFLTKKVGYDKIYMYFVLFNEYRFGGNT